jgi:hypothetical protein
MLPTGNFKWMDPETLGPIEDLDPEGATGFIVEVDVEYPEELHDKHNDLPFLCEKDVPPGGKTEKLMTTLRSKTKYVVHYVALQQAIKHGLIVTKVHRVLSFDQSAWLEPYIAHNTKLRQQALNKFIQDLCKLFNNAVYGKTLENKRGHMNMELVVSPDRMAKLLENPAFLDRTIYAENVVAVQMAQPSVYLNKPIYVGLTVLDISKWVMYDFHYDKMLPFYGKRLSILYMDTDAFIYAIHTKDVYDDMLQNATWFDTSDYRHDHKCYSPDNKKVLGKMKDEMNGEKILKFVGLRAKLYAIKTLLAEIRKAKGVKKIAVKKQISFEDYHRCLVDHTEKLTTFQLFRSNKHTISTVKQTKLSLSPFDDKRHILNDGIHTLAWGHRDIPQNQMQAPQSMEVD